MTATPPPRWGEHEALVAEVLGEDGDISAHDVLRLRRAFYKDGVLEAPEAELMFNLHRQAKTRHPEWDTFYVEGLSDHFFWRKRGDRVLSEEECRQLIDRIADDDRVEDATELKLLLNLLRRSSGSTPEFKGFVQRAALESIMTSATPLFGMGERSPGVIDDADVEIVRWLVYGQASENGLAISRQEADFLFDLNDRTSGQPNAPAWTGVFAKAIAMHVLYRGDSPDRVDEPEAAWLIERIDRDGRVDDNERALLGYIRQEAAALAPPLEAFCGRHGV
jgi:hypothetical protein